MRRAIGDFNSACETLQGWLDLIKQLPVSRPEAVHIPDCNNEFAAHVPDSRASERCPQTVKNGALILAEMPLSRN